jgi:hypothetical protein
MCRSPQGIESIGVALAQDLADRAAQRMAFPVREPVLRDAQDFDAWRQTVAAVRGEVELRLGGKPAEHEPDQHRLGLVAAPVRARPVGCGHVSKSSSFPKPTR